MFQFLGSIHESKYDFAYADGKWTLKELLQHMVGCRKSIHIPCTHLCKKR
jgi:hypothetical protein